MKRATVVASVVGAAVVGVAIVAAGTAHAGTNGQQVRICVNGGDFTQLKIAGTNQEGDFTEVAAATTAGTCTSIPDYWWKGGISIDLSGSSSGRFSDVNEDYFVEPYQETSDWFEGRITVGQ